MKSKIYDSTVHFIVITLIALAIIPFLITMVLDIEITEQGTYFLATSFLSWIILLFLTLILVIQGHIHRRIALYGMLVSVALFLLSGFFVPAVT